MITTIPRLSGEEWQRWANQLLIRHYGPTEYQRIQDNDRGDAGIEGFTISNGHAYQAYGCEEPLSTSERYEKQRVKMTRDIAKFIGNHSILERIFGTVKITRWVLFVPYYDSKQIVLHASQKTSEVVNARLSYIAESFRVMVCQEDDFCVERDQLINAGIRTLQVSSSSASSEEVTSWALSNVGLSTTLDEKLRKLPTIQNAEHKKQFHHQILKWYLEGQSILEALRNYPDVYGQVISAKSHRENFLVMSTINGRTPQEILLSSVNELLKTLQDQVKELHSFSAEALAHEAVADWLLRCPLDFPEVRQNV